MYISQSYYESLIGRKITLLSSNIKDLSCQKTHPQGRIIGVTKCQQLIIHWYSQNHPNYLINLETDRVHFHDKQKV